MAEKYLQFFYISNENKLRRPFDRGEISGHLVRLSVSQNKVHVSRWDVDEGRHMTVASNREGVPRRVIPNR